MGRGEGPGAPASGGPRLRGSGGRRSARPLRRVRRSAVTEALDASATRRRFPGLSRRQEGRLCVFADAPGGTQVPESVIQAMTGYLRTSNANVGGAFETSRATDELIADARRAAADLLGCDPDEVAFGPNMTTL